jgi:hypothetical protein
MDSKHLPYNNNNNNKDKTPYINDSYTTKEFLSSEIVTSIEKKRELQLKKLKSQPGSLCISDAFPPKNIQFRWQLMMKAHDTNPHDGKPLQKNNIHLFWMPNASWARDGNINGYVFTVEKKDYSDISSGINDDNNNNNKDCIPSSKHKERKEDYTRIIPDMFPLDKMFHGLLCIRLPNHISGLKKLSERRKSKMKIHKISPIETFRSIGAKQMEESLLINLKDDDDFSSDSCFAGYYVSQDEKREWEENVWIIVQTGDKDISRTTRYFIEGLYNPSEINDKKNEDKAFKSEEYFENIVKEWHDNYIKMKRKYSELDSSTDQILSSSSSSSSSSSDIIDTVNIEEMSIHKDTKKTKRKTKAHSRGRSVTNSSRSGSSNKSGGGGGGKVDLISFEERLQPHLISTHEKKAWKYVKVIQELINSTLSIIPPVCLPEEKVNFRIPEFLKRRNMYWEKELLDNSQFITEMEWQVKLKRLRIANKLARILGYDLSLDFNIHPESRIVDKDHCNIVHVTTNTFAFNKKNKSSVFYRGAFCRRDIDGPIPVPISPVSGITLLYGPSSSPSITSSSSSSSSSLIDKEISKQYIEDCYMRTIRTDIPEYVKKSHSILDYDLDMGGTWTISSEPSDSIDCYGAFPFGTGRMANFLRLSPEDCSSYFSHFPSTKDDDDNYNKSSSSSSSSSIISNIHTRKQQTSSGESITIIPPSQWGPRGIWNLAGAKCWKKTPSPNLVQGNTVLFTWNDKRYERHPRLSKYVFRDRTEAFRMREMNLGWSYLRGTLHLKPAAVCLASPKDPNLK